MSVARRRCSECGDSLAGRAPQTKTCGQKCRSERSRRLRRQAREQAEIRSYPEARKHMADVAKDQTTDELAAVVRDELRPVVREAITEDTWRAIEKLVGLAPEAVSALAEDLQSSDATIRQRAYTLALKYSLGHDAVVKRDENDDKQLVVNFNIPRPGDDVEYIDATVELEDPETRVCDMCGADKPVTEFIAGSYRCEDCYANQRQKAAEILAGTSG